METVQIIDCALARWQPRIGDPGPVGWATVLAYALAAVLALRAAVRRGGAGRPAETAFWIGAGLYLALLSVNKQLDLQTLLTQVGRCAARLQGWYDIRRAVQAEVILGLVLASVAAGLLVLWLLRRDLGRTGVALAGLVWITAFVLVRAVGFHHVDALLGADLAGIRLNWAFELGGIALFAAGALLGARRGRRGRLRG